MLTSKNKMGAQSSTNTSLTSLTSKVATIVITVPVRKYEYGLLM